MVAVRKNRAGQMTKARTKFEATNPERFKTAQDIVPGARNLSNRQISQSQGWNEEGGATPAEHPRQGTLFEHPHMVNSPPQWEDMHPKQQKRVLAAAADYGVTPESMKRSYTAQLQRGLVRDPDHASFYSERGHNAEGQDLPRERLIRSSQETGTPFHVTAATNAITSPQMAFVQTKKSGEVSYPNAETAEAAVKYAKAGMTGEQYVEGFKGKYPHQGYPSNLGRAIDVTKKVMGIGQEKMSLREAWNPGGRAGAGSGDKVRAYHNAWVDPQSPEGNFFVSDTHSGGAGMAPHLAGTPHETQYLSIAGIHSLHDKVAREVNEEHGLSSVSRSQSLQWNQEKHEASDQGSASAMFGGQSVAAMQRAEPNRNVNSRQHENHPDQGTLF